MLTLEELRQMATTRSPNTRGKRPCTGRPEAVARRYLETRSVQQTADDMGCSTETVWNVLAKFRMVASYVFREDKTDE